LCKLVYFNFIIQDGLWLVAKEPSVIQGYQRGILTPNFMEFTRLYEAMVSFGCAKTFYVPALVLFLCNISVRLCLNLVISDGTSRYRSLWK